MVTKLASMSTPHSPIVWSVTSSGGEEISDRDTSGRVEDELGERLANWELQRSTTGRRLAYSSRSGPTTPPVCCTAPRGTYPDRN